MVASETKWCTACRLDLPPAAFTSSQLAKRSARCAQCRSVVAKRHRAANRERINARQRADHAANREARNASRNQRWHERDRVASRDERLRRVYGISIEQYNEMLERQGGVCAICQGEETVTRAGTIRALSVDHCHATGRVRGLLCANCNTFIGMAEDDPVRLLAAMNYLAVEATEVH